MGSKEEFERIIRDLSDKGKAEFVLHREHKDLSGTVVAESHGVYQIRSTDKTWAVVDSRIT